MLFTMRYLYNANYKVFTIIVTKFGAKPSNHSKTQQCAYGKKVLKYKAVRGETPIFLLNFSKRHRNDLFKKVLYEKGSPKHPSRL